MFPNLVLREGLSGFSRTWGSIEVTLIPISRKPEFLAALSAGTVSSTEEWIVLMGGYQAISAPKQLGQAVAPTSTSKAAADNQLDLDQRREIEKQRISEEKRLADQKRITEETRLAEERRLAEAKRLADGKRAEEERQKLEQARIAEAKRLGDAKRAEEERIANDALQREQKLAAEAKERERLAAEAKERERQLAEAKERDRLAAEVEAERKKREALEARLTAEAKERERLAAEAKERERQLAEAKERERQQAQAPQRQHQTQAVLRNDRRLALVIGNDGYKSVQKLLNAKADARAIAAQLEASGFKVTLQFDLTERAMKDALRTFRTSVEGGDEVIVFFAGHGVQLGAANYLLPVDIRGDSEEQVKDEAIPLQRILDDLSERKARFSLAIIDACRDNPFKGSGRTIGGRGLAPAAAASGQMVIFSAGAGQQALDRLGDKDKSPNGLFTRIFIKEMAKPGVSIDRVVRTVRNEVVQMAKTVGHEQVPALYDQTLGDFFFVR